LSDAIDGPQSGSLNRNTARVRRNVLDLVPFIEQGADHDAGRA
jgi:hypothetical protein